MYDGWKTCTHQGYLSFSVLTSHNHPVYAAYYSYFKFEWMILCDAHTMLTATHVLMRCAHIEVFDLDCVM